MNPATSPSTAAVQVAVALARNLQTTLAPGVGTGQPMRRG